LAALTKLQTAVANLGLVQGAVGSGENVLADAIGLANSQITNQSAAESQIRDSDIATQAANLTKTQTLEQSSVAALAQANAAPQALLKLLQ
jgi:flagellin